MAEDRIVVLRNIKMADRGNEYHLRAKYNEDNDLILEGQDFSTVAEDIYGNEEYEYTKTIKNKDLTALRTALNISDEADIMDYTC